MNFGTRVADLGHPAIRLILYNWLKGIRPLGANFFPKNSNFLAI